MANTRKSRVPLEEQIRLITECRNSGMVDAEWCRQNDIAPRNRKGTRHFFSQQFSINHSPKVLQLAKG